MSSPIGTSVRRADGEAKVRGTAVYGMDYAEPGVLTAAVLRAFVPAGRIARLDTAAAAALPGVHVVATAADAPHRSGWMVKDQDMFAREEIRYVGEPIAAVAAETEAQARAAVAAIELEVEPLQAVLDLDEATQDGIRLLHPEWESHVLVAPGPRGGNVAWEASLERGDVDGAFATADLVVEDEFRVPRQHQSSIEPHCAVARPEHGRFIVHTPAQYPFLVRDRLAEFLGERSSAVRVVTTEIGGAFGGKLDAMLEPIACVLARRAGRPVRVANDRRTELQTAWPRENAIVRLRTAVSAEGDILAQEGTVLMDNGAYSGETVALASVAPLLLGGTYRVPACRYVGKAIYTNTQPTAAFRGVCGVYLCFAQERHLDRIANELGRDRLALRRRNALREGEAMVNGQVLEDAGIHEALDRVEAIAPWSELTAERRPLRGVGIAATTWITNPGPGNATVKVNEDGTIGVVTGAAEIGTGAVAQGVRQIVAEELGVRAEDVVVLAGDTDAAGYDAGAQGSRTTFAIGNAARSAAEDVGRQLREVAAEMLEAAADDLEVTEGHVRVLGSPSSQVSLAAVAQTATWTTGPIAAADKHIAPPIPFESGCMTGALFTHFAAASYHAHLAEVEVDPDTGRVDIVRYVVAQDVGRIINPQAIEGQVHGGVAQGIGYALYEELRLEDGRVVDASLEDYRLPTALDVPPIEISLFERPCPYGPYGAKGAAEPSIVLPPAAIANAISDAIGQPFHSLPITPFAVLRALRAAQRDAEEATP